MSFLQLYEVSPLIPTPPHFPCAPRKWHTHNSTQSQFSLPPPAVWSLALCLTNFSVVLCCLSSFVPSSRLFVSRELTISPVEVKGHRSFQDVCHPSLMRRMELEKQWSSGKTAWQDVLLLESIRFSRDVFGFLQESHGFVGLMTL